jgi:hypothetical protein
MTSLYKKKIKQQVPDPSDSYERSHPEHEAGMGRMDSPQPPPSNEPDAMESTVEHAQGPRQVNAHDVVNGRVASSPVESVAEATRTGNMKKK